MHVQGWFSDPAHRASGRLDFDKRTQRFDTGAAPRLLNLADPHGRAHVTVAEHRDETLTSNLLTVTIPGLLFSTPTPLRHAREVYDQQPEAGDEVRDDFLLREGRLYSWLPPRRPPWPAPSRAPRMRLTPLTGPPRPTPRGSAPSPGRGPAPVRRR